MKKAFLFPGQGSQIVGMGKDFYDNFSVAKQVFQEVDDALNEKLSHLIFNGPIEELTLTANAQPAIMATSIAILRVLLQEKDCKIEQLCDFVAGHSLGEYTALCAAGSISLSDTAKLLKLRGQSMQGSVAPGVGGMVAVLGMELEKLNKILDEVSSYNIGVCEVANDNCPGQLVISGHTKALEMCIEKILEAGSKAIKLPVSAPFHCSLMDPVKKIMEDAFAEIKVLKPVIPMVSNVLATSIEDVNEITKGLIEQISGRVRWRESILFLKDSGVDSFFELGAGKVLAGIMKRIDANQKTINIQSINDIAI